MSLTRPHREELAAIGGRLRTGNLGVSTRDTDTEGQIPGGAELANLCFQARRVAGLCDLLELESADPEHVHHDHLQDHADPPFIWDL
jgi:hypothetical protein